MARERDCGMLWMGSYFPLGLREELTEPSSITTICLGTLSDTLKTTDGQTPFEL